MPPSTSKINLLPQEILDQRRYELWYPWIISVGIILLLLVGLLFVGSMFILNSQQQEMDGTRAEIASTQKAAGALAKYETEKKKYDARAKVVKSALAKRLDPYLCGLAVTYYLPGTVSIESMKFDAVEGVTINGVVEDTTKNPTEKDWKGVTAAIDSLEKADVIRNLWLTQGTMNDSYSNYESNDTKLAANKQENYPDVVDQFAITGDLKLTIDAGKKGSWTSRLTTNGGQK